MRKLSIGYGTVNRVAFRTPGMCVIDSISSYCFCVFESLSSTMDSNGYNQNFYGSQSFVFGSRIAVPNAQLYSSNAQDLFNPNQAFTFAGERFEDNQGEDSVGPESKVLLSSRYKTAGKQRRTEVNSMANQPSAGEFDLFNQDFHQTMKYLDRSHKSSDVNDMVCCSKCSLLFPNEFKLQRHLMTAHFGNQTQSRKPPNVAGLPDDPLVMDLMHNAKEMEQLQRINEIIAGTATWNSSRRSYSQSSQENPMLPLYALMPSMFKNEAQSYLRDEQPTRGDTSFGGSKRKYRRQDPVKAKYAIKVSHERNVIEVQKRNKQEFDHNVGPCSDPMLFDDGFNLSSENIILEGSVAGDVETQKRSEESFEQDESNFRLDLNKDVDSVSFDEYKTWLTINLEMNPSCFNFFGLHQEDFHKLMQESCDNFLKNKQEIIKRTEKTSAEITDDGSKKFIFDLDRNKMVKYRRRKIKKAAAFDSDPRSDTGPLEK